jgi:RHS repeat-associated protein
LLFSANVHAQDSSSNPLDGFTPAGLQPGSPAGSYSLSGFDTVNPYNGNLNFSLPLLHVGGRGGDGYTIQQLFSTKWTVTYDRVDNGMGGVYEFFEPTGGSGLSAYPGYSPGALVGRLANSGVQTCYNSNFDPLYFPTQSLTRLTFAGPDGTEYELHDQLTQGVPAAVPNCPTAGANRGRIFTTSDGQSATFISDYDISDSITEGSAQEFPMDGYFKLRDGTVYRIDAGNVSWMRDRNGNKLSFTYGSFGVTSITDSLNRQITIEYSVTDPTYGLCNRINYNGFGATPRTIWVTMGSFSGALRPGSGYSVQSPHSLFPEFLNASNQSYDPTVVTGVVMPNGRGYKFYYNSYYELARVELPTGGALEYDWGPGLTGGPASGFGSTHPAEIYRRVLERRVYSGGGTGAAYDSRMTLSRPESYNNWGANIGYVTVNQYNSGGSLLTSENHYYYGGAFASMISGSDPTNYSPWEEGKEYQTDFFASDGTTLLRRVSNSWTQRYHVSWAAQGYYEPSADPFINATTTTLVDTNQVSQTTFSYDQYNNQTDTYEYNYGSGAAGPLLRHMHTDYLTINPVNNTDYTSYNGAHIRNLPARVSVYDGGGNEQSRSTFEYDNYASDGSRSPLTGRSGITGLDSSYTTSYTTRGNVTASSRWLLSTNTPFTSFARYDIAGNVVASIDPLGRLSQLSYSDSFSDGNNSRNTYAFPTSRISAVPDPTNQRGTNTSLTASTVYDYWTGHVSSFTDANGQTTLAQYNDTLDRLTLVDRPDGGRTTYTYVDQHQCGPYVQTRTLLDGSGRQTDSYQFFDGLGRGYLVESYDPQDTNSPWVKVDTQYDSLGRVSRVSNPYRSTGCTSAVNPSGRWTTSTYDALGRVKTVTTPDSAVVTTNYNGNQVTVTDQAGKQRSSVSDALGRLAQVTEDPVGLAYATNYSYDTLGNLRKVDQGGQLRYFMYDSLSRLVRAKNPEQAVNANLNTSGDPVSGNTQWSLGYSYDADGNLYQRTDARNVTTTYTYDNLNRVIRTDYTDGTPYTLNTYDFATNGRGRYYADYESSTQGTINVVGAYDAVGRPTNRSTVFYVNATGWTTGYNSSRTYDYAGDVLSETYPSGRIVTNTYDAAGRLSSFSGNLGDGTQRTYSTNISYDEASRMTQEQFGMQTPLYLKRHYNVRGQLYDTRLSTLSEQTDAWSWNRGAILNYYSTAEQSAQTNEAHGLSGTDNNGNLLRQNTYVPTDANATYDGVTTGSYFMEQDAYSYDSLNRLTLDGEQGYNTSSGWGGTISQGYTYDRWGNRQINAGATSGGLNSQQFTIDAASNRLYSPAGGMSYDNAGNLTQDIYSAASQQRAYDAENRMTMEQNSATSIFSYYKYDAAGKRVRRTLASGEVWQFYGFSGELVAEYAANASASQPQKEYGYRSGELLVTAASGQGVNAALSSFVTSFYNSILDRQPNSTELSAGISSLSAAMGQGQTAFFNAASQLAQSLFLSTEYTNRGRSNHDFVYDLYVTFCGRQPDAGGWAAWEAGVPSQGRANTLYGFSSSGNGEWVNRANSQYSAALAAQPQGGASWLVSDQLGTPRMIADQTGNLSGVKRHDYLPYGEELGANVGGRTAAQGYAADSVRQKYTGYERDVETGLDFAQARYYASAQGRFAGVDPLLASAHATSPQSWNRYAYVGNNPLVSTDPTGMNSENAVNDPADDNSPAAQEQRRRGQQQQPQPPQNPAPSQAKNDIDSPPDDSACHVQVRATKIGGIGGYLPLYHSYIVTQSSDEPDVSRVFRAGPDESGTKLQPDNGVYEDKKNPNYTKFNSDYEKGIPPNSSFTVPGSCKAVNQTFMNITNQILDANIAYHARTTNSNAYVFTLLNRAGMPAEQVRSHFSEHYDIHFFGWGIDLLSHK